MPKIKAFLTTATVFWVFLPATAPAAAATTVTLTGTVQSVSGNTIIMAAANRNSYTVNASGARVTPRSGATIPLSYIMPRDRIQVRGSLSGPAIAAASIRDMSLTNGNFTALVRTISGNTFTLQIRNLGRVTVVVDSSTVITRNGQSVPASTIAVGSRVRVGGIFNSANRTVFARTISL